MDDCVYSLDTVRSMYCKQQILSVRRILSLKVINIMIKGLELGAYAYRHHVLSRLLFQQKSEINEF